MPKRKMTEKAIQALQKEGRGHGHGADYKPWLEVQDVSSMGTSRRVHSPKTGREHHLLSNVEYHLFLLLEWSDDVVDIREQFPLDRDLTQEIAASLGIAHSYYDGTHVPIIMTVDFLVTRLHRGKRIFEAFDAKVASDVEDARTLEKLEITRYYCENAQIPYRLVFDTTIPQPEVTNIDLIRASALKPHEREPYPGFYEHHKQVMASQLERHRPTGSLTEFCNYYDRNHGIPAGEGLRIAKQLMYDRTLLVDLANPDLATAPMESFRLAGKKTGLSIVGGR